MKPQHKFLKISCPLCGAKEGEQCRDLASLEKATSLDVPHVERTVRAQKLPDDHTDVPCPLCGVGVGEKCRDFEALDKTGSTNKPHVERRVRSLKAS